MNDVFEMILVGLAVLVAVSYLARRFYRRWRRTRRVPTPDKPQSSQPQRLTIAGKTSR